ncbi:MAG TPA: hypothetical protein VFE51_20430 [Verrucomicrobiae bacterium]|nr:hypothetical protein [Verrucomicrobiae bacterium]
MSDTLNLRAGELVQVRSKKEILLTLDSSGRLDGMPFMPQMFDYCGKEFRVLKRAHKTCDTVFPIRGRRVAGAVHLEMRCDGQAYGGCQAGCLIFWKEAWLKRTGPEEGKNTEEKQEAGMAGCTEERVWASTRTETKVIDGVGEDRKCRYTCQATTLPYFTSELSPWDLRQYIEDYISGNVGFRKMVAGTLYVNYNRLINAGVGLGPILRWLYDKWQRIAGGLPYPSRCGEIQPGQKTPVAELNLQPGEWVRVKPYSAILATLDTSNKNRGLRFDAEMVPYCGRTLRVLKRVNRIVNEQTGEIQEFKNPCIILDGAVCQARYSECRLFCPRAIYSYWREIWLERVENKNYEIGKPEAHRILG